MSDTTLTVFTIDHPDGGDTLTRYLDAVNAAYRDRGIDPARDLDAADASRDIALVDAAQAIGARVLDLTNDRIVIDVTGSGTLAMIGESE